MSSSLTSPCIKHRCAKDVDRLQSCACAEDRDLICSGRSVDGSGEVTFQLKSER